jgi:hypothetical protein
MKKIHYFLVLAMSLVMAASISSCEDVPAPYQLFLEENGGGIVDDDTTGSHRETPFSVPAAIKAQGSGKTGKYWVKGYIVGYIPTGGETSTNINNTVFGVPTDDMKSNIVLAPSADEQIASNCMAIQLPMGEVRDSLNLKDHSDKLGMAVTLYGSLEKYFGSAGVKEVSFAMYRDSLTTGIDPDSIQIEFEHKSIKEFLELKDTKKGYKLTGVVKNIANTTYGNFDLVEDESSIYIYGLLDASGAAKQFANMGISEGDTLTLTGIYKDYNGKAEIANARYVSHVKGGGEVPPTPIGDGIVLDFSSNTWGLPEGSANGATDTQTFTSGDYTITLTAPDKYYYNATSKVLMLGKKGATLTLPAFDFAVSSIEVVGAEKASAAVVQNFYVGETAVSASTTGAQTTNKYEIAADYQAAGNQYTLKVESAHNTQISKIVIYKAVADKD